MDPNPTRLDDLMLNDRGFVFDPNTGESYQLSTTGLACLRSLQHGTTAAGVLAGILEAQEVDPLTARWDLDAFFWEIKQLGWL
ncbi:MAG: PqqD family protein [Akkermansiaceae bacterium]|nr:PqqD family protein [Akkermansiaceae bacterium]MCF7732639.1 PqqD family protein [Akkermansiaceae bacterium]